MNEARNDSGRRHEGGSPRQSVSSDKGGGGLCVLLRYSRYSLYVLLLMMLTYLMNKLDRYMLAVVARPTAQEIHFGDQACQLNDTVQSALEEADCSGCSEKTACLSLEDTTGVAGCKWDYTGTGTQYDLLAGPIFTLVFTFAGVPLGFAADLYNRKLLLSGCLLIWATCVLLTGFAQQYWQLAVLRFGIGFGESSCVPTATSLLADYFAPEMHGTALGVYNWGIYFGYSLAYAVGNFITDADIMSMGWRWAYFLPGGVGIALGVLMLVTLKEPPRSSIPSQGLVKTPIFLTLTTLVRLFLRPALLFLCLAGSVRNAAVCVWSYCTETYFESLGQTSAEIGAYMSWVPMVSGPLGLLVGGLISDRMQGRVGSRGRIAVIFASQLLATPFVFCVLFLEPPWAYLSIIPSYIIGELWYPITLVVLMELVPEELRNAAIASYIFIITNIGGNMQMLVDPLKEAFRRTKCSEVQAYRDALYLLYPGQYILGAIFYLSALLALQREFQQSQREFQQSHQEEHAQQTEEHNAGTKNAAYEDTFESG